MAKPFSAIGSIITIVVFFALIAVSTVIYSGDPEQKVRVEENFFWRNGKAALDYVWLGIQGITDISLGQEAADKTAEITEMATETGVFDKLRTDIQEEWNKDGGAAVNSASSLNIDKVWEWRRNESGAEVIFKDKDGEEHVVSLPFKFLAE
jgi:hypothetical protein